MTIYGEDILEKLKEYDDKFTGFDQLDHSNDL